MRLFFHGLIAASLCSAFLLHTQSPPADSSPRQVVAQFCELDSEGMRFDPAGALRMAKLLLERSIVKKTPIIIIRDYSISKAKIAEDKADLFVEYVVLGQIDDHFSFKPFLPGLTEPIKMRVNYHLERQNDARRSSSKLAGGGASQLDAWRIQYADVPSYVRPQPAIRYLSRIQNSDPIASNRQNAARTIAILQHQRKAKLVSDLKSTTP